jgi:3',5'-cyclic AMP phosphodiesterase CpdA
MILVQISDTHIHEPGPPLLGRFETSTGLVQAIEVINAMQPLPDLILHTGDIASSGSVPRYEAFRRIASELTAPVVLIPGNHDDRDALRKVFGGTSWLPATGDFLHHVIDDQEVRIICCDSVIVGKLSGEMCPERLTWLEARLSEAPERPSIVALHHPPSGPI